MAGQSDPCARFRPPGTRHAARSLAADWLARIGLKRASAHRPAAVLSSRERQKLALVRHQIRAPQILFLDEDLRAISTAARPAHRPFAGRGSQAAGVRIVMATHDIGQARRLASEVLFIYRGGLHEAAPAISGLFRRQ